MLWRAARSGMPCWWAAAVAWACVSIPKIMHDLRNHVALPVPEVFNLTLRHIDTLFCTDGRICCSATGISVCPPAVQSIQVT